MYDSSGKCIFRNVKPFTFVKPPSLQKFERHTHFDVEKGDYDLDKYYVAHKHAPNFNVSQKGNNVLNEIGLPEMYFKADTTYQNKYPKYSKDQEIVQRWQTENGTPNEFNQMMRAEANKIKIEDVENEDSDYKKGLDEVKKMIKGQYKKAHHISAAKAVFDEEASERRKVVQKVPVAKIRPVKIGPAIDEVFPTNDTVPNTVNPTKTDEEVAKVKVPAFPESKKQAMKEAVSKRVAAAKTIEKLGLTKISNNKYKAQEAKLIEQRKEEEQRQADVKELKKLKGLSLKVLKKDAIKLNIKLTKTVDGTVRQKTIANFANDIQEYNKKTKSQAL